MDQPKATDYSKLESGENKSSSKDSQGSAQTTFFKSSNDKKSCFSKYKVCLGVTAGLVVTAAALGFSLLAPKI